MEKVQYVDDLLKEFRKQTQPKDAKRIIFRNIGSFDVYNPTAPFNYKDKTLMIGRVEKRDSEYSEAVFFVKQADESYSKSTEFSRFKLQDPFISSVDDIYVFGGTEIFPHPDNHDNLWWRTKFFYGKDLKNIKELTVGPNGMKDVRLIELKDGRIGVFTRPQGKKGGRGKIGFTIVDNLLDLNAKVIQEAPLLDQFDDLEWGGVNETTLLSNGKIGVLGHIAKYSENTVRHYYPMVFCIDPDTFEYSGMKIIAERANFLDGPSKRHDLIDVLFSAGLIRHKNGKATLYVGVSDVEVQSISIDDPFLIYERK